MCRSARARFTCPRNINRRTGDSEKSQNQHSGRLTRGKAARALWCANMRLICTTNKAYSADLHVFELQCNWLVGERGADRLTVQSLAARASPASLALIRENVFTPAAAGRIAAAREREREGRGEGGACVRPAGLTCSTNFAISAFERRAGEQPAPPPPRRHLRFSSWISPSLLLARVHSVWKLARGSTCGLLYTAMTKTSASCGDILRNKKSSEVGGGELCSERKFVPQTFFLGSENGIFKRNIGYQSPTASPFFSTRFFFIGGFSIN